MLNINRVDFIDRIVSQLKEKLFIKVEASGRHVHLSRKDVNLLFGEGYRLTKYKELSQPGQFACLERVTLKGPKGIIKNVAVLGPERGDTQVEISKTDALILGIDAPIRESGKTMGTPGITIEAEKGEVRIDEGVIIAKRHIHLSVEDAEIYGVKDKEIVRVKVFGERPLIFDDVLIRVSKDYKTFMHIDYDEANACGYKKNTVALILKKQFHD